MPEAGSARIADAPDIRCAAAPFPSLFRTADLLRDALATADSDFVRPEPRARSSRPSAKPRGSGARERGRGAKSGKHRLALVAGIVLAVVIAGILANALVLQKSRHPAPLLGGLAPVQKPAAPPAPARPQRQEAQPPAAPPSPPPAPERSAADREAREVPSASKLRPPATIAAAPVKPTDPIADMLKISPREARPEARPATASVPRPPAPVVQRPVAPTKPKPAPAAQPRPASSNHHRLAAASQPNPTVAAAQRALVRLGFVLEADGLAGPATRKAIERFERERGLPARGTLSPDIVRRLAKESGIPIE